jgi:dynein heavy chain 2
LVFQLNESQLNKNILLSQILHHRTGVVIVGPSGCDKLSIWKILNESCNASGISTTLWNIIPKSGLMESLLGLIDVDTRG